MSPLTAIFSGVPLFATYAQLPSHFFTSVQPNPVAHPELFSANLQLAAELGISPADLMSSETISVLAGNSIPGHSTPIAMAYAGHQFGHFVPQLGDGRAILLGEVAGKTGQLWDIHLKGAGQTQFSRQGDGRAPLGPVIREYVVSEAMHALGIPTTRALAAIKTGEVVYRETPLPGAIIARVAKSHIRVGTFQYFAAHSDIDGVRTLADFAIQRIYPEFKIHNTPYSALLHKVIDRQAQLVAKWMCVGFIHGVMNTDNTSISGETLDYGPCAFLDHYDPDAVFSAIDRHGRYAYNQQPQVMAWNMARFAETLLPILNHDPAAALIEAEAAVAHFFPSCQAYWLATMRQKLGLLTPLEQDKTLIEGLLTLMAKSKADFTITFRSLDQTASGDPTLTLAHIGANSDAKDWVRNYQNRIKEEPYSLEKILATMHQVNPVYIPRNHQIQAIIDRAIHQSDFTAMSLLNTVLANPFAPQPQNSEFETPPSDDERITQTFCGT